MSKRDYYEVLSVNKTSSKDELKTAYRKLAIMYHPDKNPGNAEAEEKFKEASEAYDVLSNDDKRARYDRFGHDGLRGAGASGFNNTDDIFSAFSDIFGGGIFDDFFGGSSRGRRREKGQRGSDIKIPMPLTLEEIAKGTTKTISLKKWVNCNSCSGTGAKHGTGTNTCLSCAGTGEIRQVSKSLFGQFVNVSTCPHCNGSGEVIKEKCNDCHGEGRVRGEEEIKIDIPAGVEEGNYLPLQGKGNAGKNGGIAGNLIVVMEEKEHDMFIREGNHIIYKLTISFPDAVLGNTLEVPTLWGEEMLTIEPGIQPGTTLTLRDKGIPNLNSYGKGNQYVMINIFVPNKLANKEKEIIKELSEIEAFYPENKKSSKSGFFEKVWDKIF